MEPNSYPPTYKPICPILALPDDWFYGACKTASSSRCLQLAYLASARGGYITNQGLVDICKEHNYILRNYKRAVLWGVKQGCVRKDLNGNIHFKSIYDLVHEFRQAQGPVRKQHGKVGVTRIPGQTLLSLKASELRPYIVGGFVKVHKARKEASRDMLRQKEEKFDQFGYCINNYVDKSTGEQVQVKMNKWDLEMESYRLGDELALDIDTYEEFVSGLGELTPKDKSKIDTYRSNFQLPIRLAQLGGVNLFGEQSMTNYGSFYTQVKSDKNISLDNVVMHPAVLVGMQGDRKAHEGTSERIYAGKPDPGIESSYLKESRIYTDHVSLKEFSDYCGLSSKTIRNYEKKHFSGRVITKQTEVVLGKYDTTLIAYLNIYMDRSRMSHDTWFHAIRRKANSMHFKKMKNRNTRDILIWGAQAIDWNRPTDLTVLKFKGTRYLVEKVVDRPDLERK